MDFMAKLLLRGPLQGAFQGGGGLEAHGFRSRDLHGLARLWIAAHAGGPILHLKGPEPDQLDLPITPDSGGNSVQNGGDGILGGPFGGIFAQGSLDSIDEFGFVHGSGAFGACDTFCKAKTDRLRCPKDRGFVAILLRG